MKKILLIIALIMPMALFAQSEDNSPISSKQTTFESFTSTYGHIVKFKDYDLPDVTGKIGSGLLSTKYTVNAKVREVMVSDNTALFLLLTYRLGNDYPERTAYIAYEDVIEVNKALKELVKQSENDSTGDASYLENKFRTKDDFYLGYYIEKTTPINMRGKVIEERRWFVCLDDRYNHSTAFFPDAEGLINLFETAIQKMEELR